MKIEIQASYPPSTVPERSPQLVLASKTTKTRMATVRDEIDLFVMISVAFIVALHLSLFVTGLMAAWLYCWQYSGAFAP